MRNKLIILLMLSLSFLALSHSILAQEGQRPEADRQSPIPLNPSAGQEIGFVYQAFLSPHQEGGEEEDTPDFIPPEFHSTASSVPRNERTSRGHAVIEFTKDLSKAYVYLAVENVNPDDIVMLHLHCGRPGQLGPILVDFALAGNINEYLADGMLTLEVTNADIEAVLSQQGDPMSGFTLGCPIVPSVPGEVVTIAGMELIARQGELYFNLHTKGQTYFGDIRGQFYLVSENQ